jgi:hypothetical protein
MRLGFTVLQIHTLVKQHGGKMMKKFSAVVLIEQKKSEQEGECVMA